MDMTNTSPKRSDILIVGAGAFGLSTALALLSRPAYSDATITIIDAASRLPNTRAASVDTSRILRADYAVKSYTKLVSEAKSCWKDRSEDGWGGQGRFHDAKLLLTAQPGTEGHVDGYLEASLENLKDLARSGEYDFNLTQLKVLQDKTTIKEEMPLLGVSGDYGYMNSDCGWVSADASVRYLLDRIHRVGGPRLRIRCGANVVKLLYAQQSSGSNSPVRCHGVELHDGSQLCADLTVLSAGAWTPSLVDLDGQAIATGQVLAYLDLSQDEQEKFASIPIYFNVSRGMFMVPPHDGELKIGRHGFGYQNLFKCTFQEYGSEDRDISSHGRKARELLISVPWTEGSIPPEAETACKEFLVELFPEWKNRQFYKTRVCWYCDTPTGDFLIDYHPRIPGLFIATGDSGHGFKVLPIIGEKIVDAIQTKLDPELRALWRWRGGETSDFHGTNDGTRGGRRGMSLETERSRGSD